MSIRTLLLAVQVTSYIGLGILLMVEGLWKFALAQWLLAIVQGLVFS